MAAEDVAVDKQIELIYRQKLKKVLIDHIWDGTQTL